MSRVLPILFNTEMVRAILYGRKTVTRRLIKQNVKSILNSPFHEKHPEVPDKQIIEKRCKPPFERGDILYVRETWSEWTGGYLYKAWNEPFPQPGRCAVMKWSPSIHMPKAAARIFLKVKDVRVERLQDMTETDAMKEGLTEESLLEGGEKLPALCWFPRLWNSTIKKADLEKYGWNANPWVWVIEFERCEKPEKLKESWEYKNTIGKKHMQS